MTSRCGRCGGCIIGEPPSDYYQARQWRCINCGWYREDVVLRQGRTIDVSKRGCYQLRGSAQPFVTGGEYRHE